MTINDLIVLLSQYTLLIFILLTAIPLTALVYAKLIAGENGHARPHRYVYSLLVYLTSLPGVFAVVIIAYTMFFVKGNILNMELVSTILPIISMFITMTIIKKNVNMKYVPGFEKLRGLYLMLTTVFVIALIIVKTRIFLFFGGSFITFAIIIVVLIALFKFGKKAISGPEK